MSPNTIAPLTQESTLMHENLSITTLEPAPIIETREISDRLSLILVTADRTPVVVPAARVTLVAGERQRYEIECQHPTWGSTTWEISWTLNGVSYGATAEAKPTGPLILTTKGEGPKYSDLAS